MARIGGESQRLIEKDFFAFPIRNAMSRPILANVSVIPVEALAGREEFLESRHRHEMYISSIYKSQEGLAIP